MIADMLGCNQRQEQSGHDATHFSGCDSDVLICGFITGGGGIIAHTVDSVDDIAADISRWRSRDVDRWHRLADTRVESFENAARSETCSFDRQGHHDLFSAHLAWCSCSCFTMSGI